MNECPDFDESLEYETRYRDDLDAWAEIENEFTQENQQKIDWTPETISSTIAVNVASYQSLASDGPKNDTIQIVSTSKVDPEGPVITRKRTLPCDFDDIELDSNNGHSLSKLQQINKKVRAGLSETRGSVLNDDDFDQINRQKILRRIPKGGYVSMTSIGGRRVYLRLKAKDIDHGKDVGRVRSGINGSNLLETSYDNLRLQIEKERELKLMKEIEDLDYSEDSMQANRTTDLWVEKFKPCSYLELLSDDGTNRNLLRWLKLWDKIVFGRDVKLLVKNSKSKFNNSRKDFSKVDREFDEWNRPNQKVALLCGPPGLGKTTLAHIIAKQAGYKPVEMNASDDRSVEAFKNQIESATQMKSVIGQDPRPNCLIIDEIDGAPSAAIDILMSVLQAKPTVAGTNNNNDSLKKKRRKNHGFLQRPIICICNDQYASALRQLRNIALLVHFPQTVSSRLASRLMEISQKECLKADMSTLLALCEKSENDIRSCLLTLQFVHGRQKELKMIDVCSMDVGQKDVHKNLFSVWQNIFRLPKHKRIYSVGQLATAVNGHSLSERFLNTLSLVQRFGDYNKIHLGLYENYTTVKYKDHGFSKASYGIDWLCFSDLFNQEIERSQNYSLMVYLPFPSVVFHLLFASNLQTKIQFPSSHYDFIQKVTRTVNIVDAIMTDLQPSMKIYINNSQLILDVLPSLLNIICPSMRQINRQLYSEIERIQLKRLVDTMIDYSLNYKQQLESDGQYVYRLDHPIDLVATFPGSIPKIQQPYATKQLISREIEQEKLRKSDKPKQSSAQIPNHLQKLQPKEISKKDKPLKDFFGRVIQSKFNASQVCPDIDDSQATNDVNNKDDIWFHFKEGYSNAVRKKITIESLM